MAGPAEMLAKPKHFVKVSLCSCFLPDRFQGQCEVVGKTPWKKMGSSTKMQQKQFKMANKKISQIPETSQLRELILNSLFPGAVIAVRGHCY